MATKAFFFKSGSTWNYGTFESDGTTPNVELTVPAGKYRSRWETVNNIVQLTIVNANNQGELSPFRSIPITDVASDLIGTPYANRAAFESANSSFFASDVPTAATQSLQATALNQPMYGKAISVLTRVANVDAYSDRDAILGVGTISVQKFDVSKLAGRGYCGSTLVCTTTDTGLAGKTIKVAFYEESPDSPVADNAAFSYRDANALIFCGEIPLTFVNKMAQVGVNSDGIMNVIAKPTTTFIYYEVIAPPFTPSAFSTTLTFVLRGIQN